MKRPALIVVGTCRARAIRGPKPPRPEEEWYWRAEVHEAGGHRTVWTGWASRVDAQAYLVQLVASGGAARQTAPEPTEVKTVRDLLECWMGAQTERSDLRSPTLDGYRGHARVMVEQIGSIWLDRLTRRDLDAYVKRVRLPRTPGQARRVPRADSTLHQDFVVLRMAWAWGRSIGVVPDRELAVPDLSSAPVRPKHTPDPAEINAVLTHLPEWVSDFLRVQYATGARLGELAEVRVGDVDPRACTVRLTGKTGTRVVPVQSSVARDLGALCAGRPPDARLWLQTSQTIRCVNRIIGVACEEAGVAKWTTHALRRTAVDRLMRAPGVDIATAAAILGHSPVVLLKSYRQVSADDKRKAVAIALAPLPAGEVVDLAAARTSGAHKVAK